MRSETVFIQGLNKEVMFHIGTNQNENSEVLDNGLDNDLWFHANSESSCHIVANLPTDIERKSIRYIIKQGALLCKINTNKLKSKKNVEFVYAQVKDVKKTDVPGMVHVENKKFIVI